MLSAPRRTFVLGWFLAIGTDLKSAGSRPGAEWDMVTEDRAIDRDVFTLKIESKERKAVRKMTPPHTRTASSPSICAHTCL